jgi:hypothetical protein
MRKCIVFGVLVGLLVLSGVDSAQIQKATHRVVQEDPAGDVRSSGEHPGKDVVKVVLDTDGERLNITVFLDKDAEFYLKGHQAGDVIELLLDTDNNQETGGKPFFYETDGFEYRIQVGACIEYEGGGLACAGALSATPINYFSTYSLEKYTNGQETELVSEPFNWKDRGKDIEGNKVEVSVAYADMKVTSGQAVRLVVKEKNDSTFKKEYFPEVLLTLK